jgi:3-phenylpropionate/trans-cinnamate dioxygenase ferredoxin reductase component
VPAVVIIGGNLTAGAAATTLRSEGFDGPIVVVGEEPHVPYERPPLSKGYLRGEETKEHTLLHAEAWYEEHDVDLRLGSSAAHLDPADRQVELSTGERISYEQLLIATGGRNRELEVPGVDLEGVHALRTLEDADRIRAAARPGRTAVVVGAGFIGCEVTASLRLLGVEVEVVEVFDVPLLRAVGPEVGRVIEAIHRDRGVRFHFGEGVERFEGGGRVERVVTTTGRRLDCDFVVIGVGIQPNVEWLEGSGVQVDNGVLVDERCQTSVEGVYAAGDVANHRHPLFHRRVRVEHWDNALKQGAAVARSMLGSPDPFDDPHWFWSDQYEHNLQSVGIAARWDELVVRGDMEARDFVAFYLEDGIVVSVVGLDRGKEVRRSTGVVRARRPVDAALLRDEDVDLKQLSSDLARKGA